MLKKSYFNYLSNTIILIVIIHLLISFFIGDSYNYTRILINSLLSIFFVYTTIYYADDVINTIIKNKYIFLFLLIPLLQAYYSKYINTFLEMNQQILISCTYFISVFLILFFKEISNRISIKKVFSTIIILNISIFSVIFFYFFIFMDYIDLLFSIKRFFTNIRFLNHLQTIFIPLLLLNYSLVKSINAKILICTLIIINFILLFYTGARGSLYSIAISSFIIYFISNKNIKNDILLLLFISIFSYFLYQSIIINFTLSSLELKHLNNFSSSGRLLIYQTIFPFLFDINYIFNAIGFASEDIAQIDFLHPHNLLLYIFLGFGSFSLFIFLFLLMKYLINILFRFFKLKTKVKSFLIFTLFSILIHSMVSGLYIIPLSTIIIIYIIIIINSHFFKSEKITLKWNLNNFFKNLIILIILIINILNILYLKYSYDTYIQYKFTKEELSNDKIYKTRIPGILLFESKIKHYI